MLHSVQLVAVHLQDQLAHLQTACLECGTVLLIHSEIF